MIDQEGPWCYVTGLPGGGGSDAMAIAAEHVLESPQVCPQKLDCR